MSELVLHHYPLSPFAEKIRLILGFKRLAWRSVLIPVVMPKPDLVALTGGYRRTPVLQTGADIWCDTALIARRLDALAPQPALLPDAVAATAGLMAAWGDSVGFGAAVAHALQPSGFASLFEGVPPAQQAAFIEDRKALRQGATVPRLGADAAATLLAVHLARLERQLADGRAFVLGAQATLADFSLYHPLWFVRRAPAVAGIVTRQAGVLAWMDRVAAFGHGDARPMASAEALEVARSASADDTAPRPDRLAALPEGVSAGATVRVMPTDYGMDPVEGELVDWAEDEWVLRRTDPRAGTVRVHFPRIGYRIEPAR